MWRQFSISFFGDALWWLESKAFRPWNRVRPLHIENTKVRAWGSIITTKSKFTSHTISWRGWIGLQIKDPEDPCSGSCYILKEPLCPEAFMVLRILNTRGFGITRVPSLRVLSSLLKPLDRLTIVVVWPNCFLDAEFGLDLSTTFIVYLGEKKIKPAWWVRTLSPTVTETYFGGDTLNDNPPISAWCYSELCSALWLFNENVIHFW